MRNEEEMRNESKKQVGEERGGREMRLGWNLEWKRSE